MGIDASDLRDMKSFRGKSGFRSSICMQKKSTTTRRRNPRVFAIVCIRRVESVTPQLSIMCYQHMDETLITAVYTAEIIKKFKDRCFTNVWKMYPGADTFNCLENVLERCRKGEYVYKILLAGEKIF